MKQTRMPAGQRKEQLLDVARDIAAAEGFSALTIERVARQAGVTRPLIYAQFKDLPGLVSALVDRETMAALSGLLQTMASAPGSQGTLSDVVSQGMAAMLDAVAQAPDSWRILLNPPEGGPPELHERISAGRALARSNLKHVVADRLSAEFADPELALHLLHHVCDELVRLHLDDPTAFPRERVLGQARALPGILQAGVVRR